MIIDAHRHLEERMEPVEQLLKAMDKSNVDRVALIAAVCDPFEVQGVASLASALLPRSLTGIGKGIGLKLYSDMVTADGKFSILGKLYGIYPVPDNEAVARVMQVHPDRFYGWIFVNPAATDPVAEISKYAGRPGWIGVKSHPWMHRYPVAALDDTAAYCREKSLPLLIHLGGDDARGDFRVLLERHPGLKVIYAHAGIPFYNELWDYCHSKESVFVDLSAPSYVDARVLSLVLHALGPRKCLFGTDGPYVHADHDWMVKRILALPLSDGDKECILSGNLVDLIRS